MLFRSAGILAPVIALAVASNGDLYASGVAISTPTTTRAQVSYWNGSVWTNLGTGLGTTATGFPVVAALAVVGSDVYVGGTFQSAGGVRAPHVARWDGTAWNAMGTGLDSTVYALAASPAGVAVGGEFLAVGDGSVVSAHVAFYRPQVVSSAGYAAAPAAQSVYPNPARTAAIWALPSAPQARPVQVYDAQGREVRRQELASQASRVVLDVRSLAPGVYLIRCGQFTTRLVVD